MIWRVEIKEKKGIFDAAGRSVQKDIQDLGIRSVKKVEVSFVYLLRGNLNDAEVRKICAELLADPIVQKYRFYSHSEEHSDEVLRLAQDGSKDGERSRTKSHREEILCFAQNDTKDLRIAEIAYHPGVMDPVEESTLKGIRDLGVNTIESVSTARRYFLYGKISDREFEAIVNKVLSNKLIQREVGRALHRDGTGRAVPKKQTKDSPPVVSSAVSPRKLAILFLNLLATTDRELLSISQKGQLFLNLNEMKAIQKYFKEIGRNPTDCELETIAQTWSEHCYHKTFRGNIRYHTTENGKRKTKLIKNLFKSTIARATTAINKPWCVSVFHDNAGVIEFDEETNITFKVETHNHPCALEPFGGANTGVGGVIRDSLGTGLGAKPICNTDVFCFAPPDISFKELPAGTLHPKRVMKGVVAGVRDYGNKMGIPTVNGAILFDKKFVGNPLVFCGNVGLIPKDRVVKSVQKNDLIVVAGGRTGRDGIHGATFSSGELTEESEVISSGAVQIGNPIQEKKIMDVLLQARDQNLYRAITDCGAGGLSSAVGEMAQDLGCRVDLEKVPLKYQGLKYTEIWISESQERMVLAVLPDKLRAFLKIFNDEHVEATVIGEFTGTKQLELFFEGSQVADLSMEFLHRGIPKITKEAVFIFPKLKKSKFPCPTDLTEKLCEVLSSDNVASKEWVVRQYDHEVQGTSVLKPFVGVNTDGPSDAAILRPRLNTDKGIAVANGINVRFGMVDPFWMAASAIDEAIRQIIAVGGNLERIAILDNFCWGNPDKPDRLGSLVRAAEGCYKTAVGFQVPFISGKDSLYNEYMEKGKSLAIPGTLLISAVGIIEDVEKVVSMDFKRAGNLIYVVGETFDEMGGSIYLDTFDLLGESVPKVNSRRAARIFQAVSEAISQGLLSSAHDCSEGGLAVTLAEMAFAGGLGATIRLDQVPPKNLNGLKKRNDTILFSESNSRFVIEVESGKKKYFEQCLKGVSFAEIGRIEESPEFIVYGVDQKACVKTTIDILKQAWQRPLCRG